MILEEQKKIAANAAAGAKGKENVAPAQQNVQREAEVEEQI